MNKIAKNTICLWYEHDAEEAARFYASTFPDSSVDAVHRAPGDYPAGKQGDVLTVEFTVMGIPCLGLNGGPEIQHNEAFSFQVATEDQAETDRYWKAIVGNGIYQPRPRRHQAGFRCHDDDEENRHRRDRSGGTRGVADGLTTACRGRRCAPPLSADHPSKAPESLT